MKVVTVATLVKAMHTCMDDPLIAYAAVKVYDALPATPLAKDVERAVERLEAFIAVHELADYEGLTDASTIITALHAATELARQYREDYEASVAAGAEVGRRLDATMAEVGRLRAALVKLRRNKKGAAGRKDGRQVQMTRADQLAVINAALAADPIDEERDALAELLLRPGMEVYHRPSGGYHARFLVEPPDEEPYGASCVAETAVALLDAVKAKLGVV